MCKSNAIFSGLDVKIDELATPFAITLDQHSSFLLHSPFSNLIGVRSMVHLSFSREHLHEISNHDITANLASSFALCQSECCILALSGQDPARRP